MKAQYESYRNRIEEEYNRTQRLTSTVSLAPVHAGVNQDDIWVDVFENVDEVVALYEEKQKKIKAKMVEIETQIEKMEDEEEKTILLLRYMENLSFKEIDKRLPFSESTIYRKHSKALDNIEFSKEYLLRSVKTYDL